MPFTIVTIFLSLNSEKFAFKYFANKVKELKICPSNKIGLPLFKFPLLFKYRDCKPIPFKRLATVLEVCPVIYDISLKFLPE